MKPLVFSLLKKLICFLLSKSIGQSIDYQIVTNERIKDHEKLFYQLTVIKDQFPIISASYAPDSLKVDKALFWVKFQMIMASLNYKLYTTLRANLSLLNAELYQLELMVMISFIFFSGKLAVEQGVL
jgi:hypothetical protein